MAEALKIMLCDDKQHDMQKTAAFIKRLATFSLYVGSADTMAGMLHPSFSFNFICTATFGNTKQEIFRKEKHANMFSFPLNPFQPWSQ